MHPVLSEPGVIFIIPGVGASLRIEFLPMASGLKVTAPVSVSNINCGFDALGAAMDVISDEMIGRRIPQPGVRIAEITGLGKQIISLNPQENTAGIAILRFLEYAGISTEGVELSIHKRLKPGSGLGSSAGSSCAAVVLANGLFGQPLHIQELFPLAILGEHVASRAFHGDNVAPCLFGGIVLVRDVRQLDIQKLHVPVGLYVTLLIPEVNVFTSESRKLLQPTVPLPQMVKQSANLGAFILALERSDFTLMQKSLQDHVIESQRAYLIPGYYAVRDAAYATGVIGCGISGSGPSLFAFAQNTLTAERAGEAMQRAFKAHGVESQFVVTKINTEGTVLH